jgi:hypothetical protein
MDELEQTDQVSSVNFLTDADDPENVKYEVGAGDCRNITNFIDWNAGLMHGYNIS